MNLLRIKVVLRYLYNHDFVNNEEIGVNELEGKRLPDERVVVVFLVIVVLQVDKLLCKSDIESVSKAYNHSVYST